MIGHTTGTLRTDSFSSLGFESLLGTQKLQPLLLEWWSSVCNRSESPGSLVKTQQAGP